MTTSVVNLRKTNDWDVYCGRGSIFGNPFKITPFLSRQESIAQYRIYFFDKMRVDPSFKEAVLDLKGKVLACYCKPLSCHCDVIAGFLNGEIGNG